MRSIRCLTHARPPCPEDGLSSPGGALPKGRHLAGVAQTLGISVEEVVKVRRQLRHLNWSIVGAAYELVRWDRRNQLQELYTRQIQAAVALKLALPGGDVEV